MALPFALMLVAAVPAAELLSEARSLYANLEYAAVVPLTKRILEAEDVDIDTRLDAHWLQGSSLAIMGDIIGAEKAFRFLLRGRPEFDAAPATPPKILAVFRKVQAEERAIAQQMAELARKRIVDGLTVIEAPIEEKRGGRPIEFRYRIQDPFGAVTQMAVSYRRKGDAFYSSLALAPDASGHWRGVLPGEWTANEAGLSIEYFVSTKDADGAELVTIASAASPRSIEIEAGSVESSLFYESPWFWVAAGGVLVAAGSVAGYLIHRGSSQLPDSDLGEVRVPLGGR